MKKSPRGFTLIELITVVFIIGILASIALVKYADLLRKSQEGAQQGNLGSLRSAISIYYGDMDGHYPSDVLSLTQNGKYLNAVPFSELKGYHTDTAQISSVFNDAGGWRYDGDADSTQFGSIWVNCTHTDSKGASWSSY